MYNSIFTLPSDFKIETVKKVKELNKKLDYKVTEFYGSLKTSKIGSGRKYFELPEISLDELKEYLDYCKQEGFNFNYTLNLSCIDNKEFTEEGRQFIVEEVQKLVDAGVTLFTVAMPSLVELLWTYFPQVKVTLSIISGIDSLSKAETFCKYPNVEHIYIHERVNRQISLLKGIVEVAHKYNKKVGMIVNSFCLSDCPYRQYHYNFGAHATYGSEFIIPEYYGSKCALMKINDKRNVLNSPWVRPNDIDIYASLGIERFKVSGREMHSNKADILKVVEVYNSRKFDGNLAELFMCFTHCAYADIFNIKNDEALDKYLKEVFSGENICNFNGCTNCMKCAEALSSISLDQENKEKWSKIFEDRMTRFKTK